VDVICLNYNNSFLIFIFGFFLLLCGCIINDPPIYLLFIHILALLLVFIAAILIIVLAVSISFMFLKTCNYFTTIFLL